MALDYDSKGNIETHEFYNDNYWCQEPADLILGKIYCDESKQEEWNLFCDEIVNLFENKEFLKKIEMVNDSRYFSEEDIEIILMEKD